MIGQQLQFSDTNFLQFIFSVCCQLVFKYFTHSNNLEFMHQKMNIVCGNW